MRGPSKLASDLSVRDRVRRLPRDSNHRADAKDLLRHNPDATLQALLLLLDGGDVTQAHLDAHLRWLDIQENVEDLA